VAVEASMPLSIRAAVRPPPGGNFGVP